MYQIKECVVCSVPAQMQSPLIAHRIKPDSGMVDTLGCQEMYLDVKAYWGDRLRCMM